MQSQRLSCNKVSTRVIPPARTAIDPAVSSSTERRSNKRKQESDDLTDNATDSPTSASTSASALALDSSAVAEGLRLTPSQTLCVICVVCPRCERSYYLIPHIQRAEGDAYCKPHAYTLLDGEEVWQSRLLLARRIQTLPNAASGSPPKLSSGSVSVDGSSSSSSKEAYIRLLGCSEHQHQHCYTLCAPCKPFFPHLDLIHGVVLSSPPPPAVVPLPLCRSCKLLLARSCGSGPGVNSWNNRVYRISESQYELTLQATPTGPAWSPTGSHWSGDRLPHGASTTLVGRSHTG